MSNKNTGDNGEKEVVRLVKCPNCGKKMMLLAQNNPLYDVQCTACQFREQIKTNDCKPKGEVFGAGWEIMDKALKSGMLPPPLIVNFKWKEKNMNKQKILFFPFVKRENLIKYELSKKAKRSGYKMFRYSKLLDLPHFVLYEK